jgi:predicted GNAT family acetyltransferase
MHAKMTRDRKKNFIATIEKTIGYLEQNNKSMTNVLKEVVQTHFQSSYGTSSTSTSTSTSMSPGTTPIAPQDNVLRLLHVEEEEEEHHHHRHIQPAAKRICRSLQ